VTIRERFAAANRLQRSKPFKIIATIVIVLAAVATFATYAVRQTAPPAALGAAQQQLPEPAEGEELTEAEQTVRSAIESSQKAFREVMRGRTDWRSFGFGTAVVAALAITVVWLGLGLTYLSLLVLAGAVGAPLLQFEPTATAGKMFLGIVALTASFTALLQLVRLALGHSDPVCSIARVVLDEAVRMKISLVFIVILIIGLAALPNALDPEQPLRYRVQSFLSFSTGLSFWTIAILVLLFSVATVAFEQRDKIIWQTMTKPVSTWSYVLGKWLGVSALSAVLLAVCASGIFLFVEYLRGQPALGEREAYVALAGGEDLTEDRWILETQVLASRVTVENEPPFTRSTPEFQTGAEEFIKSRQAIDPAFAADASERSKITEELYKNALTAYRSIEPGRSELFIFRDLGPALERDALLTFRHRIDAGGNRPDEFYVVSFEFTNGMQLVQRMGPGFFHSATLWPSVVRNVTEADLAAEKDPDRRREMAGLDGSVAVRVTNGDIRTQTPNSDTITFPPGGLELSYSVGGYRANFLRAMLVLWGKLVFLAIVAVWASTFLSFPVASLVAFGVFLAAEGSGYLRASLESFATSDTQGNVKIFSLVAAWVTQVVSGAFGLYGDLRPTRRLVQGELIPIGDLALGFLFLLAGSAILYVGAAITLRRRELATYSGR
jgi:hypothetical protein